MHGWATDRRSSTASKFSHATDAMRSSVILSVVRQVTAIACLVACSGGSASRAPRADGARLIEAPHNAGASGSATVVWKSGVHVIEQAEGYDALISVSTDGSTLVFDRSLGDVPKLEKGDIFVIKGLLARRVVAAESHGDEIGVLTVPAGLLDILTDARIHVASPIRFGVAQALAGGPPARRGPWSTIADVVVPPLHAQAPVEERRKAAEQKGRMDAYGNLASSPYKALLGGWDTDFSATPAAGRVNLSMQLKRSEANVVAVITGDGYISDFDFSSDIDVKRGIAERVQMEYRKFNGTMNFQWAVQTTAKGALRGNARMKLPAAIEIPLYQYLGGLPLFLEISSAVIIQPAFGAEYEFSRGAFRITWDGTQMLRVKEGNVDADGNVTGDLNLAVSEAGAGAPVGIVVAFAAPRVELSIGVSRILKFDGIKQAAAKADEYFDRLVTVAFGAAALERFKKSPMSKVTGAGIMDATLGSSAAAYIELTTSSGQSHSGSLAMVPCTRTDLHFAAKVGASAKAFGAAVGDVDKEIFKKDYTRVVPSEDMLCKGV